MFTTLFVLLVLLTLVAVTYLILNPKSHDQIESSKEIPVTVKKVYDEVRDLKTWDAWSPWLLHAPQKPTFSESSNQPGSLSAEMET